VGLLGQTLQGLKIKCIEVYERSVVNFSSQLKHSVSYFKIILVQSKYPVMVLCSLLRNYKPLVEVTCGWADRTLAGNTLNAELRVLPSFRGVSPLWSPSLTPFTPWVGNGGVT
jgi:hypothetical protein